MGISYTSGRDWIDILQALLTPLIAVLGSYIAWQQWRTNQNRLKLERFEDRFKRFEATRKFLQELIQRGDCEEADRLRFLSETVGSRFVFDSSISAYLDELNCKAVELWTMNQEMRGPGDAKVKDAKKRGDLKKWFIGQLRELETKFAKYF